MQEMKIFLTFQKQAYAIFFAVILSLVRGITYSAEIGIALEPPMAILSLTFCADTYTQEIVSRRSEVWRLRPMKKKNKFYLQTDCSTGNILISCRSCLIWIIFSIPKPQNERNGAKRSRK